VVAWCYNFIVYFQFSIPEHVVKIEYLFMYYTSVYCCPGIW